VSPITVLGYLLIAGIVGTFIVASRAALRLLRWKIAVWRRNRRFRPPPPPWEAKPIRAATRPDFVEMNKPRRGMPRPYYGYQRGATRPLVEKKNIR